MEAPNQQQNWLQEFNHMVLIYSCRPGDQELHSVCLSPWLASDFCHEGQQAKDNYCMPKNISKSIDSFLELKNYTNK